MAFGDGDDAVGGVNVFDGNYTLERRDAADEDDAVVIDGAI